MMKRITLCVVYYLCAMQTDSQGIKINEPAPDIEFNNVFNYSSDKIRLSDLKGKLVILDFWSFSCGGCLISFPRIDSLQKKFGDKIQIILVNKESKDSTRNFFSKRKKLYFPNLPFITGDTMLNKLFPHYGVPYHVWIDTSGIVRYFPVPGNTAEWSIEDFLSGKDIQIRPARSRRYIRSFMDKEWIPSLEYYSYISRCINGINLEASDHIEGYLQLSRSCLSVVELYKIAYGCDINNFPFLTGKYDFGRPGRIILEVKDRFKYVMPVKTDRRRNEWLNNYSYNYHLFWPESKKSQLYEVMQKDLERFFNLDARVERRKVKCLVLVRINKNDKLKTKGGAPIDNFFQVDGRDTMINTVRLLRNQPFEKLASRLETIVEYNFSKPFIDQTGYKGNIDLKMDEDILDHITVPSLRKELRKYGLDLVEREWPLEVLVIKEK